MLALRKNKCQRGDFHEPADWYREKCILELLPEKGEKQGITEFGREVLLWELQHEVGGDEIDHDQKQAQASADTTEALPDELLDHAKPETVLQDTVSDAAPHRRKPNISQSE